MPNREPWASPEALEREIAEISARIDHLKQERKVFGRLGFSSEQMKLEMSQLERRRAKYEQVLRDWQRERQRVAVRGYRQVES